MVLSFATLLVFVALTPGAAFMLGINRNPYVTANDVFDTPTQEIVTLVLIVMMLCMITSLSVAIGLPTEFNMWFDSVDRLFHASIINTASNFIEVALPIFEILMILYVISFLLGRYIFPMVMFYSRANDQSLQKLIYNLKKTEFLKAWVLTQQAHNGKNLLYIGNVKEVKTKDGVITSITIKYPVKTYVDYNKFLQTSHSSVTNLNILPRPVSITARGEDKTLYISQENIANVYFEKRPTTAESQKKKASTGSTGGS